MGQQLLRSATSVAANYRAAGRARSKVEFTARIGITVEEADETVFRLELLAEAGIVSPERVGSILKEANELVAIFAAAHRTARRTKTRVGMTLLRPLARSPVDPIAERPGSRRGVSSVPTVGC